MTKRSGWYYEKRELRHTPSIQAGLTMDQETQYRREGARFILQVGNKMGLRYETMATGVVYFHRFYMVHTFQTFPRHVTACCCLFLAGKVEETPKKCRDIMKTARSLIDDTTWAEFGADPREEVMTLERILLQTIKFDFIVEHPYTYLLKYAKCLKGDKKRLPNMVQMAWTFVNDSLCTTLCLQWEPEIIAIALMYLAGKLSKFDVTDWVGRIPKHQRWWDMYVEGISMELLEDICHQVLDLYSPNRSEAGGASSEPSITMPSVAPRRPVTPTQSSSTAPPPAKKAKKEEAPPPQAPPPTYPNQQRHYPPPAVTTPQAPPPHYATQPPPSHYSSGSHPPSTYHQPGAAGHYPAPPTNQPPPSHYAPPPHGSTSSSYYPPPPSTNNPPPNYAPAGPSSNYPPPSSYPHSSSRPYYPPSS
ncbi:putative cyclin-K [Penaeus vannamei]|uniref:Cyclin-K n=1 Tax=Penaeus vannamei TaxID=6689 RepID=A0A423T233_PENVA|nr:putative cyclin-K [Penaeus vannamei]